jgi:hypothetical protein
MKGTEPPRRRHAIWAVCGLLAAVGGAAVYWWTGSPPTAGPPPLAPVVGPRADSGGPGWFRDRTAESGLAFTYRNGEEAGHFTILESLGGGVALIDYDGDGLLDVFVTGGGYFAGKDKKEIKGHPCKLYRNLGGWRFKDVTKEVGLDVPWFYTHGAAVADFDRDGWPDLLVTGYGRLALFHNQPDGKGGRRFVDVTDKVGLRDSSWSTSAGWADLDGDGYPDLYVCHYLDWSFANHPTCPGYVPSVKQDVCPPGRFRPLVHAVFRNEKGKAFRNVSAEHGLGAVGRGLGVVLVDVNDDGRPDIYVANDATNNLLYLNRGGKLEEKGLLAGVAVGEEGGFTGSMGVDAGDYDGSGRPSLWVTNFQGELHSLYRNLGGELFLHQSRGAGIGAIGLHYVGFGTGFVDVDNDGWEDLVIANGHVVYHPPRGSTVKQRPVLLHNVEHRGRRFFKDVSSRGGPFFQVPAVARGVAIGDLDNDGWPDLVVSHTNSPVGLLRNEAADSVGPARWLGVKLVGRGHRDVVGSTVVLEGTTRRLTRFAKGGGSYLSANDPRILFGLGPSEQVRRVTVKWSWGKTQSWENLTPNGYWELHEGKHAAKPVRRPGHRPVHPENAP